MLPRYSSLARISGAPKREQAAAVVLVTILFSGVPQYAGGAEPEVEGQEAKVSTGPDTEHAFPPRCWLGILPAALPLQSLGKEMLVLKRGGR